MTKLLTYCFLFIVLMPTAQSEPRLVSTSPFFDFGSIPRDAVLEHHFWIKSVGSDTIKISEIKTGCSCALVTQKVDIIPPGDSVEIGIRWDAKRLRGSISRSPRIYYNGIEQPLRVHMQGTVLTRADSARPVASIPYKFEFGKIGSNDIDSISFELRNYSNQDLTITKLSKQRTEFKLYLPESVPAGGSSKGYVLLNNAYRDKEFATSITLQTDDHHMSTLTIPVKRKIYK